MRHDSMKPLRSTIDKCIHLIPDNEELKHDLVGFLENLGDDDDENGLDYWSIVIGLIQLRIDLNQDLDGWQKEFIEALK